MSVRTDAEKHDVEVRRRSGAADDPRLIFHGGGGEVGRVRAHPMDTRGIDLDLRQQPLVRDPVVRVGMIRRHGALVAPEQIDVAPADARARERGTERRRRRSARQCQRETAQLLEALLDPRDKCPRQFLDLADHDVGRCGHAVQRMRDAGAPQQSDPRTIRTPNLEPRTPDTRQVSGSVTPWSVFHHPASSSMSAASACTSTATGRVHRRSCSTRRWAARRSVGRGSSRRSLARTGRASTIAPVTAGVTPDRFLEPPDEWWTSCARCSTEAVYVHPTSWSATRSAG
jgi:hypothetical protein